MSMRNISLSKPCKDLERRALRALLTEGAKSKPGPVADRKYFAAMRRRARRCLPTVK